MGNSFLCYLGLQTCAPEQRYLEDPEVVSRPYQAEDADDNELKEAIRQLLIYAHDERFADTFMASSEAEGLMVPEIIFRYILHVSMVNKKKLMDMKKYAPPDQIDFIKKMLKERHSFFQEDLDIIKRLNTINRDYVARHFEVLLRNVDDFSHHSNEFGLANFIQAQCRNQHDTNLLLTAARLGAGRRKRTYHTRRGRRMTKRIVI